MVWKSIIIIVTLAALGYADYYRAHDDKGNKLEDITRCFPWQTVEEHCVKFNVPCGEGFKPGEKCTTGKLFGPGDQYD